MKTQRSYTIGQTARLSGVSVRTLRFYEEIGLLRPSGRTAAGYRVYSQANVLRLQQIMIGRTLGRSLEEIRLSLDAPDFDHAAALHRQHQLLQRKATETAAMLRSVEAALAALESENGDVPMQSLFEGFDTSQFEEEVKARWGESEAYKENARRMAGYSPADLQEMQAEADAIWREAARAMTAGAAPDGAEGRAFCERHRQHVTRWFYPCPPAMHIKLAELWESDARFQERIDRFGVGLTAWAVVAVRRHADAGQE